MIIFCAYLTVIWYNLTESIQIDDIVQLWNYYGIEYEYMI